MVIRSPSVLHISVLQRLNAARPLLPQPPLPLLKRRAGLILDRGALHLHHSDA